MAAPAPPDLIVADVVMPELGGRELAAEIERRWPGIPVIFTSGYTGLDAEQRGLLREGQVFMQKPLEPQAVAAKVREVLSDRTRRS